MGFIILVAVLKNKATWLDMSKLTLASKKIMGHCKSDRLSKIYKNDKSSVPVIGVNIYSILKTFEAHILIQVEQVVQKP